MKKPKYGYCGITGDFLHIGHINFLKKCASKCDRLIVGIMSDECVKKYKGNKPIMDMWERSEIVGSLKFVKSTVIQETFDFPHWIDRCKILHGKQFIVFDSAEHKRKGADVLIKRTNGISSTKFKNLNYSQLSI